MISRRTFTAGLAVSPIAAAVPPALAAAPHVDVEVLQYVLACRQYSAHFQFVGHRGREAFGAECYRIEQSLLSRMTNDQLMIEYQRCHRDFGGIILKYVESYTRLAKQISELPEDVQRRMVKFEDLAAAARETGASLEQTALAYARMVKAGVTSEEALAVIRHQSLRNGATTR